MSVEIITSLEQICDANGVPVSGALIYVYDVGSTTAKNVWTDTALSAAGANPIVCDSSGRHDMRYIATGSYKIVVKTSAGVTLYTRDNIDGRVPVGSGALAIANGGTGSTTASGALTALGGATSAELADLTAELASLTGTLASTEKTHIATGTTAQRTLAPVAGDIRFNTSIGTSVGSLEYQNSAGNWKFPSAANPAQGGFKNLSIKVASDTTVTVAADYVTMYYSTGGTLAMTAALSGTIDLATVGANGLDAGTIAINTWYAIWAIGKDDGTTALLASTSFTAPTMPSGYLYKARIGAVQTINATATLYGTWQFGRRAQYVVGLAETANFPVLGSATAGSVTTPTWVGIALARFAPPTASRVGVTAMFASTAASGNCIIANPNNSAGGRDSPANPPILSVNQTATGAGGCADMLIEGANIYWASVISAGLGALVCTGWEDNL